jgi:glyoxylase-like metal-dependent hydrolase (beta-lactamase superfamily II)
MLAQIRVAGAVCCEPVQVREDVYAWIGTPGDNSAANHGFTANSGFVVGKDSVTVIDTGTSYLHGKMMLDAIRRVTAKPVELVILTHAVQEFIFGAAAFEDLGIPVLAHRKTADLMRARCDHCLSRLKPLLGTDLEGTRLVTPTHLIDSSTIVTSSGRPLEIHHFGWASTPGDLAVLDQASGVLFAGGLVSMDRVPEIRDADFEGWLAALSELRKLKASIVVPGHGRISGPEEAIAATESYLNALNAKVKHLYATGNGLLDAVEAGGLPAYAKLALYDSLHRRNVLHRFLQLEIQDLGGDPRSTAMPQ